MTRIPQKQLDAMNVSEIIELMGAEGSLAVEAVIAASAGIESAVGLVVDAFQRGGRLIYIGAGTSGRLGVLDASECPPTFGAEPNMVTGVIAGGDTALRLSSEGAEDDRNTAQRDLELIDLDAKDCLVAISASGNTPYVLEAAGIAKSLGATAIGIACNSEHGFDGCDCVIVLNVGEEALPGSTRLKAGTAQKMTLNMLSTAAFAKCGHVYKGLMVGVQPTSAKLKKRAITIVSEIGGLDEGEAETLLVETGWNVKLALVMNGRGLGKAEAERMLYQAKGFLGEILDK